MRVFICFQTKIHGGAGAAPGNIHHDGRVEGSRGGREGGGVGVGGEGRHRRLGKSGDGNGGVGWGGGLRRHRRLGKAAAYRFHIEVRMT